MLYYAVVFLIIALIAGFFGFFGVAGLAAMIAKILFVVFIILFIVSLIFGRRRIGRCTRGSARPLSHEAKKRESAGIR